MSCILAIKKNNSIHMIADSGAVSDYFVTTRIDEKIFIIDNILIGFVGNIRIGQILKYKLKIPIHKKNIPDFEYLSVHFVDSLINLLISYDLVNELKEQTDWLIVGYKNNIYQIMADFQVSQANYSYDAIGTGSEYALGYLSSIEFDNISDYKNILTETLESVSSRYPIIVKPFIYKFINFQG